MNKKHDALSYERAIEILRYCGETGLLERKLKNGVWRRCGNKPNRSDGRGCVRVDGKTYLTHRLIWLLVYGSWPEHEIDHLDRNPMNNQIENLRATTRIENQHNHGVRKDNSSGYIGVTFFKRDNNYRAYIALNGKRIHLGYYPTAEEAFLAYMLGKIEHHPTSPDSQQYLRELTLVG